MFPSLSSWIFNDLPAHGMLKKVARCGYRHVEISASYWPKKWNWRELCAVAGDLGIHILSAHCCHHELPEDSLDDKRYREYHEEFYSNVQGVNGLIVVEHDLQKADEPRNIALAGMLLDVAKRHGVRVSFENMAAPPEKLRKLVELDGMSFTFDPMHAAELARLDPLRYQPLFLRLVNVHAMDSMKAPSLGHAVPCGFGTLGWPEIIRALARFGYKGPITVEMEMSPLHRVMGICRTVWRDVHGESSAARFDVDLPETFAVYARRYLERQIAEATASSCGERA